MEKLFHIFGESKEVFFERIDKCGGWPPNAKSVVMKHTGISGERPCYFCIAENIRDEWNTSIFTSDDYYWYKISQRRKDSHKREIIEEIKRRL